MCNIFLENKKLVKLDDERFMELQYFLLEKNSVEEEEKMLYGIKIVKRIDTCIESEEVQAISYSKNFVKQLIKKLVDNEVTPISMIEILDDLQTIELCI